MSLEKTVLDFIEERRHSKLILAALKAFSFVYQFGVSVRNFAYDRKWIETTRVQIPVISIGNIACGGTGKTPLTFELASELLKNNRVAILSRGYRSEIEKSGKVAAASVGHGPLFSAEECGDEPYWFAQKLPGISVWVGKSRSIAARLAILCDTELLILDDGMQHRRLERDVEIIAMDAQDLFGKGYFLPRGLLRDHPRRLKEAHLIVLSHIKDLAHYEETAAKLSKFTTAPIAGTRYVLKVPEELRGGPVALFCGVAKPDRFLRAVEEADLSVVSKLILADHEAPKSGQLEAFAQQVASLGARALICTEKDAVKLPAHQKLVLPIVPLALTLQFVAGKEHWQHVINEINSKVKR
jgi:tetraacyldisaccharide 4'-kinase